MKKQKVPIRHVMFGKFKNKKNATDAVKKICSAM